MSLLTLILVLVLVGLVLWAIDRFVPMDPTVKRILNIAVIVILVIWILKGMGVFGAMSDVRL